MRRTSAIKYLFTAAAVGGALVAASAAKVPAYHQVAKWTIGGDGGWDYLTVDGRNSRLYISRGTHVQVVDTNSGSVVGDIKNTNGVHGIALAPESGHGFTSNGRDNTVTVFDLKTLETVATVPVDKGPDAIIYDNASKRVFTLNGQGSSATAINVDDNKVAGTIPLPGRPEFAVSDGRGHIYDNIEDKSEIVEIDAKELKITNTWSIAPGDGPSGLAMDRRNRRLFAVCGNEMMVVVNADTGKVVATPKIGRGPDAAGFDRGNELAISSNGEGSLTLVHEDDPDHYSVAATVPTQPGARTMAVDGRSHRIYTVTAKPMPEPAGAAGGQGEQRFRRRFEPGSFTVLVYAPE